MMGTAREEGLNSYATIYYGLSHMDAQAFAQQGLTYNSSVWTLYVV